MDTDHPQEGTQPAPAQRQAQDAGTYGKTMTTSRKMVCVIDGQGGGIGSTIIKKIKEQFGESVEIIALGTNAIATAQMLKARANRGASGENAIVQTVPRVDVVVPSVHPSDPRQGS